MINPETSGYGLTYEFDCQLANSWKRAVYARLVYHTSQSVQRDHSLGTPRRLTPTRSMMDDFQLKISPLIWMAIGLYNFIGFVA